jgi:tetratricopeptide (TPR) repeat protein
VLGLKAFAYQYFTTVADRYVYLSMLGVALAVGWWMDGHRSWATAIAAASVIGILGCLSFVQAQRWSDTETLYSYALDDTQPIHQTIFGLYQDDLAMPYLRRAAQASQIGDIAQEKELTGKGIAYVEKAMSYYRNAIRLGSGDTHAYDLLSRDLVRLGQFDEAVEVVKAWIAFEPNEQFAGKEAPGRLQSMLGTLYLGNRQFPEAVAALKQSLAEHPDPDIEKTLAQAEKLAAQAAHGTTRPTSGP